MMNKTEYSLP